MTYVWVGGCVCVHKTSWRQIINSFCFPAFHIRCVIGRCFGAISVSFSLSHIPFARCFSHLKSFHIICCCCCFGRVLIWHVRFYIYICVRENFSSVRFHSLSLSVPSQKDISLSLLGCFSVLLYVCARVCEIYIEFMCHCLWNIADESKNKGKHLFHWNLLCEFLLLLLLLLFCCWRCLVQHTLKKMTV